MAKVNVAVFMDWQNVYGAARSAFELQQAAPAHGNFDPVKVARYLTAGNKRGSDGKLVKVEIHRGLPDASVNPKGHGAADKQRQYWLGLDPVVSVRLRPVQVYTEDGEKKEREKGVDVALACSAVEHVLHGKCDVAIIFSHDSDLLPPVETICRLHDADLTKGTVETASWQSDFYWTRMRPAKTEWGTSWNVVNHTLSVDLFDKVATTIDFTDDAAAV